MSQLGFRAVEPKDTRLFALGQVAVSWATQERVLICHLAVVYQHLARSWALAKACVQVVSQGNVSVEESIIMANLQNRIATFQGRWKVPGWYLVYLDTLGATSYGDLAGPKGSCGQADTAHESQDEKSLCTNHIGKQGTDGK
jgi:hypothetical protein